MADSLFNNEKRKRPAAGFPADAFAELVNYVGAPAHVVRRWPDAQKWAVLYRYREKNMSAGEARDRRRRDMARRLSEALADDGTPAPELHDLINETLGFFTSDELAGVARLCETILAPPAPAPVPGHKAGKGGS